MDNSIHIKGVLPAKRQPGEREILYQIAALLVREKLLSPEEYLRFLSLLKEES